MKPAASIRLRLPLSICSLIAGTLAIYSLAAYRSVRTSELVDVDDRLQTVGEQLGNLFSASGRTLREQVSSVARDSAIVAAVRHADPRSRTAARSSLWRLGGAGAVNVHDVELWNSHAQLVQSFPDSAAPMSDSAAQAVIALLGPRQAAAIGRMALVGGVLEFPVVAQVAAGGATLGYVVERRRATASEQATRQLKQLIGSSAAIVVGNADNSLWTDFTTVWADPSVDRPPFGSAGSYRRPGVGMVRGAVVPISGAPWILAIEFPESVALAKARALLLTLTVIDVILLGLAAVAALALSRHLTAPLADLASAAAAVTAGDYSRRLPPGRPDELGALASAFNQMAASLQESTAAHETALATLRDSEQRYRLLFDASPHPKWVYDLETLRFVAVNESAVRLYRYTHDEFLRMRITDIRLLEDVPRLMEDIERLGADGTIRGQRGRHRRKDGQLLDVEISAEGLMFAGRPSRMVVVTDVTERVRAELLAQTAQERLAHAVAASRVVVYERSAFGADASFDWMSSNITAIFGYEITEALTPGWWISQVHHADLPALMATLAVSGVHDRTQEYRFRAKDGVYRWVRDDQRVVRDPAGAPVGIVGTLLDITSQRTLEDQSRQSQKMEAVGRLAGGVAHDFNNLLTVILAESEESDAGASVSSMQESMQEIRKAALRGASLTRQLLTFSRRQLVEPVPLDLNEVIGNLDPMLQRLIGENVQLTVKPGEALGCVLVDEGQIGQVIVNLVVNARDAMAQGGTVIVETANVTLDDAYVETHAGVAPGDYVMIAVNDSGQGMSEEVKDHLFEPFFTTKSIGKGTGLGLATCYSIVQQCGGHIVATSEVGVGTVVRAYLPCCDAKPRRTSRPGMEAITGGNETILLVEDDSAVRRIAVRMLADLGYDVLEAPDGESALTLAEEHPGRIHLLLTDVVLPKLGGRGVADGVRARRPDIRVLFMSGYSDDVVLKHHLFEGRILLLQKPFTSDALALKVRKTLDA